MFFSSFLLYNTSIQQVLSIGTYNTWQEHDVRMIICFPKIRYEGWSSLDELDLDFFRNDVTFTREVPSLNDLGDLSVLCNIINKHQQTLYFWIFKVLLHLFGSINLLFCTNQIICNNLDKWCIIRAWVAWNTILYN